MGLFDRFRKEEHKRVIRDEEGTRFETTYSHGGSRTPVSDALLSQHKAEKKRERTEWKQQQKDEYRKAFREARIQRIRKAGRSAGGTLWSDRLGGWADSMSKPSGRRRTGGSSMSGYSSPMESMFTFGSSSRPSRHRKSKKSSSGKKRYVVQGGVAYPVAGGSKKKKKNSRKNRNDDFFKFKI